MHYNKRMKQKLKNAQGEHFSEELQVREIISIVLYNERSLNKFLEKAFVFSCSIVHSGATASQAINFKNCVTKSPQN